MDMIRERYVLSCDRIREIAAAQEVAGIYKEFYRKTAEFVLLVVDAYDNMGKDTGLEAMRAQNAALYADIMGENYALSYANPTTVRNLGRTWDRCFHFSTRSFAR